MRIKQEINKEINNELIIKGERGEGKGFWYHKKVVEVHLLLDDRSLRQNVSQPS